MRTDYHTPRDTPALLDFDHLERQTRFYAYLLLQADADPNAILDHGARADDLAAAAKKLGGADGKRLAAAAKTRADARGRPGFTRVGPRAARHRRPRRARLPARAGGEGRRGAPGRADRAPQGRPARRREGPARGRRERPRAEALAGGVRPPRPPARPGGEHGVMGVGQPPDGQPRPVGGDRLADRAPGRRAPRRVDPGLAEGTSCAFAGDAVRARRGDGGRFARHQGEIFMKRRSTVAGLCLVALLATAAGCGSSGGDESDGASKASPATKGQQKEHRGGTLTMLWNGAGTSIDTSLDYDANWQVLTMTSDGLLNYRRVAGPKGSELVPDLAEEIPDRHRRRQDLRVQGPQGHQVLDRRGGQAERLHLHVRAPVQGRGARLRLLRGHRRRRGVREEAEEVRPLQGRGRRRRRLDGDLPPDRARPRLPAEARDPVRLRRADGDAEQGHRHQAAARHRALQDRALHARPADGVRAQPALQGVVARGPARRLSRQDRDEARALACQTR